jgi:hypothetical protein
MLASPFLKGDLANAQAFRDLLLREKPTGRAIVRLRRAVPVLAISRHAEKSELVSRSMKGLLCG